MVRTVEVKTARTAVISSANESFSASEAAQLFRDVAAKFRLHVKEHQWGEGDFILTARPHVSDNERRLFLTLYVDPKQVRFYSTVSGTNQEFTVAKEVADQYMRSLDARGIVYQQQFFTRSGFWGP